MCARYTLSNRKCSIGSDPKFTRCYMKGIRNSIEIWTRSSYSMGYTLVFHSMCLIVSHTRRQGVFRFMCTGRPTRICRTTRETILELNLKFRSEHGNMGWYIIQLYYLECSKLYCRYYKNCLSLIIFTRIVFCFKI